MKRKAFVYSLSALVPVLVMLAGWFYNDIYPFGHNSLMAIDFAHQYISLYEFMKRVLLTGDISGLFYSFSKSLGGNMIGIWGFNLISPFNLLYLIFPMSMMNWAIFLSILLRYGAMGMAFTHFLMKRHKGDKAHPMLLVTLATAYALNGFNVAYQMNPIFYDGMIMLPLVLIGVEEVLDGHNPLKYVFLLCLTLVLHYYMGYMICIFIVLYSILYLVARKYHSEETQVWKKAFSRLLRLAGYSIVAIGIIAIFFVPVVFNLINSKGALENTLLFEWKFQIDPLDILSKFVLGSFDNTSWSAGPNLPNIYVGSLGLFGSIYYFLSSRFNWKEKLASFVILLIFFISIAHKFTNKLWHMGQTPAGFFYRFSWIVAFFLLFLAYKAFRDSERINWAGFLMGSGFLCLLYAVVSGREFSFLEPGQLIATCVIFLVIMIVLLVFNKEQSHWKWGIIGLLTFAEVGISSAIVQSRINYIDAYKFNNALDVNQEALKDIIPGHDDFYRIAKTFYRSKNDPFMFDYPGLTNFSSNIEMTTREVFERLGNNAVDASTLYYGTPLVDALFGVRYFLDVKPYTDLTEDEQATTHIFGAKVERKDIFAHKTPVKETKSFKVFENEDVLPLAFGMNDMMANITLNLDVPAANHIAILSALGPDFVDAVTYESFEKIVVSNMESQRLDNGQHLFQPKDIEQEGMVKYVFTPTTDDAYFMSIPETASTTDGQITMFLNGEHYDYSAKFTNTQLWSVADHAKGQPQEFEIRTNEDDAIDLTNVNLVRFDRDKVKKAIDTMKKDGLNISKWGNNFVKGTVKISPDNAWMLMTVPFDKGWTVKVDGKVVETSMAWDGLMKFPVTPGEHTIEMTFMPYGLTMGVIVSVLALLVFTAALWFEKGLKRRRR